MTPLGHETYWSGKLRTIQSPSAKLGIVYLLTGISHAARLIVSINSLRRWYDGPITVFTTRPPSHEVGEACRNDLGLQVDHRTIGEAGWGRNSSNLTKIAVLRESPYATTLCLDADTLVSGDLSELLAAASQSSLTVTTTGRSTSETGWFFAPLRTVWRSLAGTPGERFDLAELLERAQNVSYPAINTGVVGTRHGAAILKPWYGLTELALGLSIPDEIALQLLLPRYDHQLLDRRFNCCPHFFPNALDVRIWHFQGSTHLRSERSIALWRHDFQECMERDLAQIGRWCQADRRMLVRIDSPPKPRKPVDDAKIRRRAEASRRLLPDCHSRRELRPEKGLYFCAHPKVTAAGNVVWNSICRSCRLWQQPAPERFLPFLPPPAVLFDGPCYFLGAQTGLRECQSCNGSVKIKHFACHHPRHEETNLRECQSCGDYEPLLTRGGVNRIVVGLSAVAQQAADLVSWLRMTTEAGWDSPTVFVSPSTEVPDDCRQHVSVERAGELSGWSMCLLALSELVLKEPLADAYLLCWPNCRLKRNLRGSLARDLWPHEHTGAIGLVEGDECESGTSEAEGDAVFRRVERLSNAATGYLLPSAGVRSLLSFCISLNHRRWADYQERISLSQQVSEWAAANDRPLFEIFLTAARAPMRKPPLAPRQSTFSQ